MLFIINIFIQAAFAVTALTTVSGTCSYVDGTNGVRAYNGSVCRVTSDGQCRQVTNSSGNDIFVPGKEGTFDFISFYGAPPAGVTIGTCVVRATTTPPPPPPPPTSGFGDGTLCSTDISTGNSFDPGSPYLIAFSCSDCANAPVDLGVIWIGCTIPYGTRDLYRCGPSSWGTPNCPGTSPIACGSGYSCVQP
ncbi:MAG: hypothetical protein JNM93_06650 [Bacteriovoracaceae bacterium]|nr:hypothetical protein [Bacteriovoracaceae bacterium]